MNPLTDTRHPEATSCGRRREPTLNGGDPGAGRMTRRHQDARRHARITAKACDTANASHRPTGRDTPAPPKPATHTTGPAMRCCRAGKPACPR